MPEETEPSVFYLAHRWFAMGIATGMFIFGFVWLVVALIQGSVGVVILLTPWIAIVAFSIWNARRLRVEVEHDALKIKGFVGGKVISGSDIIGVREADAKDIQGPILMWRTFWFTLLRGKGVVVELAVTRRRFFPTWYKRFFITVDRHEDFIAALEAAGLPVRRLGSNVK